jgi:hypothetical protein
MKLFWNNNWTLLYLEEQKISAGLHLEIKKRACLHLEEIK